MLPAGAAEGEHVCWGFTAGDAGRRIDRVRIWRRIAAGLAAALALVIASVAPAAAAPNAALNSTDAVLRWISAYRAKSEPEGLPALVRPLSERQAFKDAETSASSPACSAPIRTAPPRSSPRCCRSRRPINWVLVRAVVYSGLPDWKELLATNVDRMPTRRGMIDKYLDGKLPTLEQIAYQPGKTGVLDKIRRALKLGNDRNEAVAIEPSPELIDVLWGSYLATGSDRPIGRIIKLLPLATDRNSVDNLITGSAAKFTLASNAVRDLNSLAILKREVKNQPAEVAAVLNEVIETAQTIHTARMRRESLAAIEELKQKDPNSKRDLTGWGQVGKGALAMVELGIHCVVGGAAYSAGLQYISR